MAPTTTRSGGRRSHRRDRTRPDRYPRSRALTVAEYLREQPDEARESLATIRRMIREAVPDARETMVSGLPAYLLGDRMVAALGAQKRSLTLYVGDHPLVANYRRKLGAVECGRGCIRFHHADDLNFDAVRELLERATR